MDPFWEVAMSITSTTPRPAIATDTLAFLKPEAMVTPGVAGGLTMMITNTLHSVFPILPQGGTGLLISAMFGAIVLASAVPLWQRAIFYVLNTLVVFCMAMGSANLAHTVAAENQKQAAAFSLISSAHAGDLADQRYIQGLQAIFANTAISEQDRAAAIAQLNQRAAAEGWSVPGGVPMQPQAQSDGFFQQWNLR
jgi:hypothetical protein